MLHAHRAVVVLFAVCIALGDATAQRPRALVEKPDRFVFDAAFHAPGVVRAKFADDLTVRLRDGALTDFGTGALAQMPPMGGRWVRPYDVSEERLDALRAIAQANLDRVVADLNLCFNYHTAEGETVESVINALNAHASVEYALPMYTTVHGAGIAGCPVPDFEPMQVHLAPSPDGVGSAALWSSAGGDGMAVNVLEIDVGWTFTHNDLPTVTFLGPPMDTTLSTYDPPHGTAVLGLLGAIQDGVGVTGACHASPLFASAASTPGIPFNVANSIINGLTTLVAGDVIDIEVAFSVPGAASLAMEWDLPTYNAIVTAVGNGVHVIEAAGNGGNDLDNSFFSTGNGGHHPFLPGNGSGALLVGAGAAPGPVGTDVDRSRLTFSNHGSAVDMQGQGEAVVTTGYGVLHNNGTDADDDYTDSFGGTSAATGITAALAAQVLSAYEIATGTTMSPDTLRTYLRGYSAPQQGGAFPTSQNIGPRPDGPAALAAAITGAPAIADVFPTRLTEGLTFTNIQICGLAFDPSATVLFGGVPVATTFVSTAQVDAAIPGSLLASPGAVTVQVDNGLAAGGVSGAFTIEIVDAYLGPAGGGLSVLQVDSSTGGPDRRVDVSLNTPWQVDVLQPVTNPSPASFIVFGMVGVPDPTSTWSHAGVLSDMAFLPCDASPGLYPLLYTLANSLAPGPCGALVPATVTPWGVTLPAIPIPLLTTLQGVVQLTPTSWIFTNGVVVRFS